MKPKHPSVEPFGNTGKWHCPKCQRVAPKEDLLNPKLSHFNCFNPHSHLRRVGKPPFNRWQCQDCGNIGTFKYFQTEECSNLKEICKYCGERPECARDCLGIFLALSAPDTQVIDGREPPLNRNPDEYFKQQIRNEDNIGALNFLRRQEHQFALLTRRDAEDPDKISNWLLPFRSYRILHTAMIDDIEEMLQKWPYNVDNVGQLIKDCRDQLKSQEALDYDLYRRLSDELWYGYEVYWAIENISMTEKPVVAY